MTNLEKTIKRQNYLSYLENNFNDKLDVESYSLDDYEQDFAEELVEYFDINIDDDDALSLAYEVSNKHLHNLMRRDLI